MDLSDEAPPTNFVDRYDELAVIQFLLDSIERDEPIQFPLREYIGIGGIGKTALLKKIIQECAKKKICNVFIDYKDLDDNNPFIVVKRILKKLLEFADLGKDASEAIGKQIEDLPINVDENISTPYVPIQLVKVFEDKSGVIIFDSLSLASATSLSILGNEIIFPISQCNKTLILIGSRSRVDWGKSKYKLWRRTKSTALLTFPLKYTKEQVVDYCEFAPDIQQITCGHPEANDIVIKILDHVQELEKIGSPIFSDYEARLVNGIVDGAISRIIPKDLFSAFCILSPFRYLNIDIPDTIFRKIDQTKNWSSFERLDLLNQMQSGTQEVFPEDSNEYGYQINEFVRKSLSLYLRYFARSEYDAVVEIAKNFYEQKFYEDPSKVQYLIEKVFHLIDYIRLNNPLKTDLDTALIVEAEFKKDLEATLAGSYYIAGTGKPYYVSPIHESSERQSSLDKLKKLILQDQELNERIGDSSCVAPKPYPNFLIKALDEIWQERRGSGMGVLEILKHYRSSKSGSREPDHYDISFRTTVNEPIGLSQSIEITSETNSGINEDLRLGSTKDELMQLGLGLHAQIPSVIQEMIKNHTEPLIIDVNDTTIPWELMHDGKEFLALRIPLGKKIRTVEVPRINTVLPSEVRILLVGVPNSAKSKLPPLKYVEDEINSLHEFFRSQPDVTFDPANDILFGEDATVYKVQKKLSSGKYKIIHFAGHSVSESRNDSGGILLYDGILKRETIKNSLRGKPLVVLNACNSAQGKGINTENSYRGIYMSGLAYDFIIGGALACIASIWELRDRSASTFVTGFYNELMNKAVIGEALRRAKNMEYNSSNQDKRVWASFILFGNPTEKIFP